MCPDGPARDNYPPEAERCESGAIPLSESRSGERGIVVRCEGVEEMYLYVKRGMDFVLSLLGLLLLSPV